MSHANTTIYRQEHTFIFYLFCDLFCSQRKSIEYGRLQCEILNNFIKTSLLCFMFLLYWALSVLALSFNPNQDGGQKGPPTSFSSVTSTNVGFGPQNFLTFSFNPFSTQVQNFKFVPSASPKLLNLNQDHPSKKAVFLVKSL